MNDDNDSHDDSVDVSRRNVLGGALGAGATLATLGTGLGMSSAAQAASLQNGNLPKHKKYNFTFVNHVTTNPFFVPTQYGAADACAAFNCDYQWTGSRKAKIAEMVRAMNSAISAGTDGIAVPLVDSKAFDDPVNRALERGIPVVSYNADDDNNNRLAYIGQELFLSGKMLGRRMVEMVGSGHVVGFIATPGQANIQPRMDGAKAAIQESGADIKLSQVATGPTLEQEFRRVESYYLGHKNIDGMFAVDGGSTGAIANTAMKHNLADIPTGGYDLLPTTLDGIHAGAMDFTIDQQPYLQGFLPVTELFLWHISGGLSGIANVNTGIKFVTQANVAPYLQYKSRYGGQTAEPKNLPDPETIGVAGGQDAG